MSDARQNILQRIRRANGDTSQDAADIVMQRLEQHLRGPQPYWSDDVITRFTSKVTQSAASYETLNSDQEIVDTVISYLKAQSLGKKLVCTDTPALNKLKWPEEFSIEKRAGSTQDKVVLVEVFAGIAETGSVVMFSSKETPISLNFLPDHFLCVIYKNSIVNTMEDLWERIRHVSGTMPRSVNIITGPSRTADVEQVIQMGAHGPRQVHLLLLG